jgi:hypothetical protein
MHFRERRQAVKTALLVVGPLPQNAYTPIVDPTLADGILDRLVHNAYRIEMREVDALRVGASKPGYTTRLVMS